MLAEIIHVSVKQDQHTSTKHPELMADAIINYLSGEEGSPETVNSLFAIETLNLIADPRFNERYGTHPMIKWQLGRPYFSTHALEMTHKAFAHSIEFVLSEIKGKYKDSVRRETGISPASHAILEERLDLIREFVREKDGAGADDLATAFLSLSSLSPGPFQSATVATILNALMNADVPEGLEKLAQNLKAKLGSKRQISATDSLCETFEYTYELIRKISHLSHCFTYRHSLFPLFLEAKLNALLDRVIANSNHDLAVRFRSWVYRVCHDALDVDLALGRFSNDPVHRDEAGYILETAIHIASCGYEIAPDFWALRLTNLLNLQARAYAQVKRVQIAIELSQRSMSICKKFNDATSEHWNRNYSIALGNLTAYLLQADRYKDAVELNEDSQFPIFMLFEDNSERWAEAYHALLNNLAHAYFGLGNIQKAVELHKQSLKFLEPLYKSTPAKWAKHQSVSYGNLGFIYDQIGNHREAINLHEQAFEACKILYDANPELWADDLAVCLNNLGTSYASANLRPESIELLEQSMEVRKNLFKSDEKRWAHDHAISLTNMAYAYGSIGRDKDAVRLKEEALEIMETLYKEDQLLWANSFRKYVVNLAYSYEQVGRTQDGIRCRERGLEPLKTLYEDEPLRWAEDYCQELNEIAAAYFQIQRIEDAIALQEQALNIIRPFYNKAPNEWAEGYIVLLRNLACSYGKAGGSQDEEALNELADIISETLRCP